MLDTFFKMLAQNVAQITSAIQADLHHLGARIETMEMKTDQTIPRTNGNTDRIQELHDQLNYGTFQTRQSRK